MFIGLCINFLTLYQPHFTLRDAFFFFINNNNSASQFQSCLHLNKGVRVFINHENVRTLPSLNSSLNHLTPRSDQYTNSPYNFNTLSGRQVMRKLLTRGIVLIY